MPTAPTATVPALSLSQQLLRMALICAAGFVGLNIVFFILSGSYFESQREVIAGVGAMPTYSPDQMMKVRIMFGVFAAVIAVVGFIAWFRPREVGHIIPALFGAAQVIGSIKLATATNTAAVIIVACVVFGVLMLVLAWFSYFRRSRPAWAFLVAITAVFAVFETFGATEIAGGLGISFWLALVFPGVKGIATAALATRNNEYVDAAVEV